MLKLVASRDADVRSFHRSGDRVATEAFEVDGLPDSISATIVPHQNAWAVIGITATVLLQGRFVFRTPGLALAALEAALVREGYRPGAAARSRAR